MQWKTPCGRSLSFYMGFRVDGHFHFTWVFAWMVTFILHGFSCGRSLSFYMGFRAGGHSFYMSFRADGHFDFTWVFVALKLLWGLIIVATVLSLMPPPHTHTHTHTHTQVSQSTD